MPYTSAMLTTCSDPSVYTDPDEFRPERFLDDAGHLVAPAYQRDLGHVSFGFGRRCVLEN